MTFFVHEIVPRFIGCVISLFLGWVVLRVFEILFDEDSE
jgi:hypothetical protein